MSPDELAAYATATVISSGPGALRLRKPRRGGAQSATDELTEAVERRPTTAAGTICHRQR